MIELNYGVLPNVQLVVSAPLSYMHAAGEGLRSGYGDMELGVKLRFIQETTALPQLAVYPIVIVPSGNAQNGLGAGTVRTFLPLWLQKSWGSWTAPVAARDIGTFLGPGTRIGGMTA